jgi:hypothetical protein
MSIDTIIIVILTIIVLFALLLLLVTSGIAITATGTYEASTPLSKTSATGI